MLHKASIKLTTPLLGDKLDETQTRRFSRSEGSVLQLDGDLWEWLLVNAVQSLHFDEVDVDTVMAPGGIVIPRVDYYRRNLRRTDGRPFTEKHECVHTGAELSFTLLITTTPTKHSGRTLRPPDSEELKTLLKFLGTEMGISPFGARKGFGRFELLKLETT